MSARYLSESASGRVLLVAPVPPPYGGVALQAGLLQKLLQDDGILVELLAHNHPLARLRFLESIPGLRTILRAGLFCFRCWRRARNKDVVHILASSWLNFFLVVCPAIVIARLRGARVVLNYRAGNAEQFFRSCSWLARPFFMMADIITTPSEFLAHVIQERIGVQVSIVPNIVNLSRFQYHERLSFRPKLLVTRHLEEIYDVESVLRAFRLIQGTHPEATLWIAGTGSHEARLRKLASSWNLTGVQFLGYVDHKALPAIYDQCDLLINASRVDNFPGSLMEASAAGLVIISTQAGGIPFVYENGRNALLVEVGDWQGLASEVERVLQCQDFARQLAAAGAELCRQFAWPKIACALYTVYGFHPSLAGSRPDAVGAPISATQRRNISE